MAYTCEHGSHLTFSIRVTQLSEITDSQCNSGTQLTRSDSATLVTVIHVGD